MRFVYCSIMGWWFIMLFSLSDSLDFAHDMFSEMRHSDDGERCAYETMLLRMGEPIDIDIFDEESDEQESGYQTQFEQLFDRLDAEHCWK